MQMDPPSRKIACCAKAWRLRQDRHLIQETGRRRERILQSLDSLPHSWPSTLDSLAVQFGLAAVGSKQQEAGQVPVRRALARLGKNSSSELSAAFELGP